MDGLGVGVVVGLFAMRTAKSTPSRRPGFLWGRRTCRCSTARRAPRSGSVMPRRSSPAMICASARVSEPGTRRIRPPSTARAHPGTSRQDSRPIRSSATPSPRRSRAARGSSRTTNASRGTAACRVRRSAACPAPDSRSGVAKATWLFGRLVQAHRDESRVGTHRPLSPEDLYRLPDLACVQGIERMACSVAPLLIVGQWPSVMLPGHLAVSYHRRSLRHRRCIPRRLRAASPVTHLATLRYSRA